MVVRPLKGSRHGSVERIDQITIAIAEYDGIAGVVLDLLIESHLLGLLNIQERNDLVARRSDIILNFSLWNHLAAVGAIDRLIDEAIACNEFRTNPPIVYPHGTEASCFVEKPLW